MDAVDQNEISSTLFRLTLDTTSLHNSIAKDQDGLSTELEHTLKQRLLLFKDENEFKQTMNSFGNLRRGRPLQKLIFQKIHNLVALSVLVQNTYKLYTNDASFERLF